MDERTQDFGASGADYATGASVEADLYAGQGPVSEADGLEARAREIRAWEADEAARQAEQREAEQAAVRSCEASLAFQMAMHEASQVLGQAIGTAIEVSCLLTWSPGQIPEADRLVSVTARHLAEFRSRLVTAAAIGTTITPGHDQPRDPNAELGELYGTALTRLYEVQRQVGGLIALFQSDMTNTPALVAMARSTDEAMMLANVANRGLSLVLDELGMSR